MLKQIAFCLTIFSVFFCKNAQCQRSILPTKEQVAWADAEMGVIIHLDINIFAPNSFQYNDPATLPDVNVFNPSKLNTDQWIKTAKAAGATYAVLTVKHGTGFCLWPSKVNNYNVGHTSWGNGKNDILKSFIASCKKYGVKPGLYYNTNTNTFYNAGSNSFVNDSAQLAYKNAVLAQLEELWSNYGKVFEIWFDGGLTSAGKFGLKKAVLELISQHQPQAILFQGPVEAKNIIRWIGNEDGVAAYPQWSRSYATTAANGLTQIDDLHGNPAGKIWCPGESDFPIRRNTAWNGGWLWKEGQENYLFTVKELTDKYYSSVGRNSNMLIGMVVNTSGLIPTQDSILFDSLGKKINSLFNNVVAKTKNVTQKITEIKLPSSQRVSQVVIQEDITKGENIRSYSIEAWMDNQWKKVAEGQSVGHKRIQSFSPVNTNKLRLTIGNAEGRVNIKYLGFYNVNLSPATSLNGH
ncbi:MAG: alpha-L-fucosidase [Ferruginibacter sp.]